MIVGAENLKPDFNVRITKGPEGNDGILVTESDDHIRYWADTLAGVIQVGKLIKKERLYSHDSLWMSKNEYSKHREMAEAAFKSRRDAKKKELLHTQARLFI